MPDRDLERILRAARIDDPESLRELEHALRRGGHGSPIDPRAIRTAVARGERCKMLAAWFAGYLSGLGLPAVEMEVVGRRISFRGPHRLGIERLGPDHWVIVEIGARVAVPSREPVDIVPWMVWALGGETRPRLRERERDAAPDSSTETLGFGRDDTAVVVDEEVIDDPGARRGSRRRRRRRR